MGQFFETYRGEPKLSTLLRVLAWSANLHILTRAKRSEKREFYLLMVIRERWGKRELERQFRIALFERAVLHPPKVSPVVRQIHGEATDSVLKDSNF